VLVNLMDANTEATKPSLSTITRFGRKKFRSIVPNFWKKIWPLRTEEDLEVEFMLEPSKHNVAAWQKLLDAKDI
jgi:hypothetical protein